MNSQKKKAGWSDGGGNMTCPLRTERLHAVFSFLVCSIFAILIETWLRQAERSAAMFFQLSRSMSQFFTKAFVSLFRTVNWDDMSRAWAGFKCGRSGQIQLPSLFPLLYNAAQQYSMHLLVASYKICCSFNPSSCYRTSQYSTCYFNSPPILSI